MQQHLPRAERSGVRRQIIPDPDIVKQCTDSNADVNRVVEYQSFRVRECRMDWWSVGVAECYSARV